MATELNEWPSRVAGHRTSDSPVDTGALPRRSCSRWARFYLHHNPGRSPERGDGGRDSAGCRRAVLGPDVLLVRVFVVIKVALAQTAQTSLHEKSSQYVACHHRLRLSRGQHGNPCKAAHRVRCSGVPSMRVSTFRVVVQLAHIRLASSLGLVVEVSDL